VSWLILLRDRNASRVRLERLGWGSGPSRIVLSPLPVFRPTILRVSVFVAAAERIGEPA
jgi:hypothetical protein